VLGKHAEAAERGVELAVAEDVELPAGIADPHDLVTIFGNLLDNAIDAGAGAASPRWVQIDSTVLPIENGGIEEIEIRIADSGPGLPSEYAEHAFTQGWSTKPTDRLHGRGLGLALVAQAVHRNHGTIGVRNDGGAVFTVRLSRQGRAERDYPRSSTGPPVLVSPRVRARAPGDPAANAGRRIRRSGTRSALTVQPTGSAPPGPLRVADPAPAETGRPG
jgi:anti-sigma regulatory factor (Ser/Thr protein kinase)